MEGIHGSWWPRRSPTVCKFRKMIKIEEINAAGVIRELTVKCRIEDVDVREKPRVANINPGSGFSPSTWYQIQTAFIRCVVHRLKIRRPNTLVQSKIFLPLTSKKNGTNGTVYGEGRLKMFLKLTDQTNCYTYPETYQTTLRKIVVDSSAAPLPGGVKIMNKSLTSNFLIDAFVE